MAKKLLKYDFQISPGQLYDLLLKSVLRVGYSIINQNRADGIISCKTGMTWKSWSGVEVGMHVSSAANGKSEVTFGGGTMASSGIRPMQIVVIGNAVKSPSKKILKQVRVLIKKNDLPPDRPLFEKPASSNFSLADELKKLSELKDKGVISADEFEIQKKRILSS